MFAGIYLLSTRGRANASMQKSSTSLPHTTTNLREMNRPNLNLTMDETQDKSTCGSSIVSKFTSLMNQSINVNPSKKFIRSISTQSDKFNLHQDEWVSLRNGIHRFQSCIMWEVGRLPAKDQLKIADGIKESLIEASKELLQDKDHQTLRSDEDQDTYFVWSSIHEARRAILQEAISFLRLRKYRSNTEQSNPLVILIVEKHDTDFLSEHGATEDVTINHSQDFILTWKRCCAGMADVLTVTADCPSQMLEMTQAIMDSSEQEQILTSALVVVHASSSSTIVSDLSGLRNLCDSHRALLCLEGPGLAMLAQSNRSPELETCIDMTDVLLLDYGDWFSFKSCAVISRHASWKRRNMKKADYEFLYISPQSPLLLYNTEAAGGPSLSPIINLWTFLSSVTVENIKIMIEDISALSESFVRIFRDCPNVEAVVTGLGCVARVSYALSRESRILSNAHAEMLRGRVNRMLESKLRNESDCISLTKVYIDGKTFLQFVPGLLLRNPTVSLPNFDEIEEYCYTLQQYINQYESCQAATDAFVASVAKIRDIQIFIDSSNSAEISLDVGKFHVVPHELQSTWRENPAHAAIVNDLTVELVNITTSTSQTHERDSAGRSESQLSETDSMLLGENSEVSEDESIDQNTSIAILDPVWFFRTILRIASDSTNLRYVAVEPEQYLEPKRAVEYVQEFAHYLNSAVRTVTEKWRLKFMGRVSYELTEGEDTYLEIPSNNLESPELYEEYSGSVTSSEYDSDDETYSASNGEKEDPTSFSVVEETTRNTCESNNEWHNERESSQSYPRIRRGFLPGLRPFKPTESRRSTAENVPVLAAEDGNEETIPPHLPLERNWIQTFSLSRIIRWKKENMDSTNDSKSKVDDNVTEAGRTEDDGDDDTNTVSSFSNSIEISDAESSQVSPSLPRAQLSDSYDSFNELDRRSKIGVGYEKGNQTEDDFLEQMHNVRDAEESNESNGDNQTEDDESNEGSETSSSYLEGEEEPRNRLNETSGVDDTTISRGAKGHSPNSVICDVNGQMSFNRSRTIRKRDQDLNTIPKNRSGTFQDYNVAISKPTNHTVAKKSGYSIRKKSNNGNISSSHSSLSLEERQATEKQEQAKASTNENRQFGFGLSWFKNQFSSPSTNSSSQMIVELPSTESELHSRVVLDDENPSCFSYSSSDVSSDLGESFSSRSDDFFSSDEESSSSSSESGWLSSSDNTITSSDSSDYDRSASTAYHHRDNTEVSNWREIQSSCTSNQSRTQQSTPSPSQTSDEDNVSFASFWDFLSNPWIWSQKSNEDATTCAENTDAVNQSLPYTSRGECASSISEESSENMFGSQSDSSLSFSSDNWTESTSDDSINESENSSSDNSVHNSYRRRYNRHR